MLPTFLLRPPISLTPILILTLILNPHPTSAHGKISLVASPLSGNTTALGIRGAIVPSTGPNRLTEVDTTVFPSTDVFSDGLGKTKAGGRNKACDLHDAMVLSGDVLPQVSYTEGGTLEGVWKVVTTDGAGPVRAVIDSGATGAFESGIEATVPVDVPGANGNINPNGKLPRAKSFLRFVKRAANVNLDFAFTVDVPAGTVCNGTVAGKENVCFMKIANANPAGPFGGVVAFQVVEGNGSTVKAAVLPYSKRKELSIPLASA